MMKITGLSHLFKWENLHNWRLTKYFFAPLYILLLLLLKFVISHFCCLTEFFSLVSERLLMRSVLAASRCQSNNGVIYPQRFRCEWAGLRYPGLDSSLGSARRAERECSHIRLHREAHRQRRLTRKDSPT